MKPLYKIILGISGVAIILVVAAVFLWSSLDQIVASAIEKYGSEVTQTPVRVSGVNLALTSGEGAIKGLTVGNPKGFTDPDIFALGNISTNIDTATVTEPTVVINSIVVSGPKVFYEIDDQGKSNLDALKKNLSSATGKSDQSAKEGEGPKLLIKKLIVENGGVSARIAALGGKQLSAKLPRIELRDIGKEKGGATPTEVSEKVLDALMAKAGTAVTSLGVDKYLGKTLDQVKNLGGDLGEKLKGSGGGVEDSVKKGGEALKGLFGN